jgi:hypothetical protein
LKDGEEDLDLVEPTGVHGSMDEAGIGPLVLQAFGCGLTTVGRTVIHDPKDTTSRFVRLLAHDFADEAIDGSDSALDFAATEDFCAMNIPSSQVGPGAFAKVLMLYVHGTMGGGRHGWLFPAPGLDAGLLIGGNDVVVSAQWNAVPDAFVQVEDRTSFVCKVGIAREDPASMLPRAKCIAAEPTPQRGATDVGDQALRNHMLPDVLD